MKLSSYTKKRTHTPMWKVSEIAASIGIPTKQLASALKQPGAPQPGFNGKQEGHQQNLNWYEPVAVKAWYAQFSLTDPAAKRREYHREYSKNKRETQEVLA